MIKLILLLINHHRIINYIMYVMNEYFMYKVYFCYYLLFKKQIIFGTITNIVIVNNYTGNSNLNNEDITEDTGDTLVIIL